MIPRDDKNYIDHKTLLCSINLLMMNIQNVSSSPL